MPFEPTAASRALMLAAAGAALPAAAQDSLPFPPVPTASVAGPSLQSSTHQWRQQPAHLPAGAPNILIIMFDDAGFAQSDAVGGRSTRRRWRASPPAVSSTTPSTPRRSVRPPPPPCSPAATTIASATARSPNWPMTGTAMRA